MLSSFLKKLLLARQFSMANGRINMLGAEKVMIPMELVMRMQEKQPKECFEALSNSIKNHMEKYSKSLGTNSDGLIKVLPEIYESFGVGMLSIKEIGKENATVIVENPIISEQNVNHFTAALVSGIFSYIYETDDIEIKSKEDKKGIEFRIQKR